MGDFILNVILLATILLLEIIIAYYYFIKHPINYQSKTKLCGSL